MSADIIPFARECGEKAEDASAPRSRLPMHYRVTLPPTLRRCWRYVRLIAEAHGWLLLVGLIVAVITP